MSPAHSRTKTVAALLKESDNFRKKLDTLSFPAHIFVYNVFDYAWEGWKNYISTYADAHKEKNKYLLLGMNPGPHGMVQTGVPFGNIGAVTKYLRLQHSIGRPAAPHPQRKVVGLEYHREEKSGERVWSCIASLFPNPHDFFRTAFILNFCPLAFFDEAGKNLTPDVILRGTETIQRMQEYCIEHLQHYCRLLHIDQIVGIGRYAERMGRENTAIPVHYVSHPSPLNPKHRLFQAELEAVLER